jgi:hypothetical protein
MWQTAYTPSALLLETMPSDFPPGADAVASRQCMQTFLASWAVLGDGARLASCELAAKSLGGLIESADGHWRRRFDPKGATSDQDAADRGSIFGRPDEDKIEKGDPRLAPTLETIAAAKALGREKFRERLAAGFTIKQHLAQVLVGLSDTPMRLDFPQTPGEVEHYLKQHEERFRLSAGSAPTDLRGKIQHVWALYLRAKVEREFGI